MYVYMYIYIYLCIYYIKLTTDNIVYTHTLGTTSTGLLNSL